MSQGAEKIPTARGGNRTWAAGSKGKHSTTNIFFFFLGGGLLNFKYFWSMSDIQDIWGGGGGGKQ